MDVRGGSSLVSLSQELDEHFHASHMSCGIAGAASVSPSDLGGHAAKGRAEEQPSEAGPVPALHQGLTGGARVGEEGGCCRPALSPSRSVGWFHV